MPNHPPQQARHESPGQAYFDVDGDRPELSRSESEDDASLTWRGDPLETGADATIVVVTNELETVTYHVHKSVICFGTKQSKFLAKYLLNSRSSRSSKNRGGAHKERKEEPQKMPSVKVELDQRDADNFPIFLDFVYSHCATNGRMASSSIQESGTLDTCSLTKSFSGLHKASSSSTEDDDCSFADSCEVTTSNAVSLRHLACKLENEALRRGVNKFIQKDLNFKTGPVYLYKAWEYKDDRLMESAQRLCAENIEQIDRKALTRLPLNLFRVVIKSLESFEEENKELSVYLSEVVCRYLEKHPKTRTAKLILELTDPLMMPYIASEAAIGYTAIVKDLEPDDAASHWDDLVRLCRRCAEAVVKEYGWSDFSVKAAVDEYLGKHKKEGSAKNKSSQQTAIDSLLFATSFAAALEQAQDDYEEVSMAHEQLSTLVKSLNDSTSLMESVQQRKDEFIEQQSSALEQAAEEIVKLRRQIKEMKQQQEDERQKDEQQHHHQERQQQRLSPPQPQQERHQQHFSPPQPQAQQRYASPQPQQYYESPQGRARPTPPKASSQQSQHFSRSTPRSRTTAPMARHRHAEEYERQQQQQREPPPDLLEMKYAPAKELISPTQVSVNVHEEKNRKREELRTKSEMRARSLLV